jgi:hypothetical protein
VLQQLLLQGPLAGQLLLLLLVVVVLLVVLVVAAKQRQSCAVARPLLNLNQSSLLGVCEAGDAH